MQGVSKQFNINYAHYLKVNQLKNKTNNSAESQKTIPETFFTPISSIFTPFQPPF
jgi:hypothetical protein